MKIFRTLKFLCRYAESADLPLISKIFTALKRSHFTAVSWVTAFKWIGVTFTKQEWDSTCGEQHLLEPLSLSILAQFIPSIGSKLKYPQTPSFHRNFISEDFCFTFVFLLRL